MTNAIGGIENIKKTYQSLDHTYDGTDFEYIIKDINTCLDHM